MIPDKFLTELDQLFHAPFRTGGPLAAEVDHLYRYAYINDSAHMSEELTKKALLTMDSWDSIIVTTANDKIDTPTTICERQAMRLIKMAPSIYGRILMADRSEQGLHTGAECAATVNILKQENAPLEEDGRYETLAYARPFHALRCYSIAAKQTPILNPKFIVGMYAGYDMYRDGMEWTKNPEYCDWILSELSRVLAYSYDVDADTSTPGDLKTAGYKGNPLAVAPAGHEQPEHLLEMYHEMVAYTDQLMLDTYGTHPQKLEDFIVPRIERGFFARGVPKPGVHVNSGDPRIQDVFDEDRIKYKRFMGMSDVLVDTIKARIGMPTLKPNAPTREQAAVLLTPENG